MIHGRSTQPADFLAVLAANDRHDAEHDESSFVGRLHEDGVFDPSACLALEAAVDAAIADGPSAESLGLILRIYAHVLRLTRAHVNPRDTFRVVNLDDDGLDDLDARVQRILFDVSCGRRLDLAGEADLASLVLR